MPRLAGEVEGTEPAVVLNVNCGRTREELDEGGVTPPRRFVETRISVLF